MDALYQQLKELAKKHDLVVVTAKQAPRLHSTPPTLPKSDVIIIDYIDILRPIK
jgi:hypothetical protein